MKTFLIRGVPMALQRDGWWLSGPITPRPRAGAEDRGAALRCGLLAGLIALADVLIWQVVPGVSLAAFGAALAAAALLCSGRRLPRHRWPGVAGGTVLALLPLVDLVQPLSLLIALAGLSAVLALVSGMTPGGALRRGWRLWLHGPLQALLDLAGTLTRPASGRLPERARGWVLAWAMPLGLGAIFAALLIGANPVLEGWSAGLHRLTPPDPARSAFWAAMALLIWPCLILTRLRSRLEPSGAAVAWRGTGLVNAASVTRALVLFNAVMAVQTGMDAIYLHGGVGLPEGISHAEYAHRGAYPLVATALLAGVFALISRRFVTGSALLTGLLLLWIAQNGALALSSLVRLQLYVEAYGLTRLRLSAALWMGLVAAGLALMLWQVRRGKDAGWLLPRLAAMAAVVLYSASLMRFDAVIAGHNLSHPYRLDQRYLCRLGDAAKPVIARAEQVRGRRLCPKPPFVKAPQDWREWGFRNARARASLREIRAEASNAGMIP